MLESEGIEIKMKKGIKVLYYFVLLISTLVGLWHFFVPKMFRWYDYLPMQYENLIVGIDWTNYCFSAFLFGTSLLLIILGKKVLSFKSDSIYFYYFLTAVWGVQSNVGFIYRALALAADTCCRNRSVVCFGYCFYTDADCRYHFY